MLGCNELGIIYEAILVLVVTFKNWINHVLKLLVKEDFGFWFRLAGFWIMISFIVPMYQGLDQLQTIKFVVAVSVVHLEVMELQFLLRHL